MPYELPPMRPPSEARSLLIRVMRGCPWNYCTFCSAYKDVPRKTLMRSVAEVMGDIDELRERFDEMREQGHVVAPQTAFLADSNAIIIDTAGRLQIDQELMAELAAIRKVASPHEALLVLDAMTGQEAVNVASGFLEHTELTGLIMTKLDGDARGGAAISAREVTGCPIKFVGVGEGIDELDVFHPDRMASRILGMGDVLTLIEKAEETYDEEQAEVAAAKMRDASFDLEDFLEQFQQLKKMGPLQQLIGMLPGAGAALGDVSVDERQLGRVEAIIRSMTPDERRNPRIIKGSRRRRIAAGSGTRPQDVNSVLKQFSQAQNMMKSLASGRNPLPGLEVPGMGRAKKR